MKKVLFLLVVNLFLAALTACQALNEKEYAKQVESVSTEITLQGSDVCSYEVEPIEKQSSNESVQIVFPQLLGNLDYSTVNSLIRQAVDAWINNTFASSSDINLWYSVTFSNDMYLCVLFEGNVVDELAAHPINVVFSICVSLSDEEIVNPLTFITVDKEFVGKFKKQLISQKDVSRFTDEQWGEIVEYFNEIPNVTLQEMIVNGELALAEDGIIVCVEVPHAIGDYIKIKVP